MTALQMDLELAQADMQELRDSLSARAIPRPARPPKLRRARRKRFAAAPGCGGGRRVMPHCCAAR